MNIQSILWHSLYWPGHEACRLSQSNETWLLEGAAVLTNDRQPCQLIYQVLCDSNWHTRSGLIHGWIGLTPVRIDISVDPERRWWVNGVERPAVAGCLDLDLNFSPATNLLPIRRLALPVGHSADVTAAWLQFPSFELVPLPQRYHRVDEQNFHYESAGGQFAADLQVNSTGFVTDYPGLWLAEVAV